MTMTLKQMFLALLALVLLTAACQSEKSSPLPEEAPQATWAVFPSPATAPGSTPSSPDLSQSSGNADVIFVRAVQSGDGTWTFHVTVEHPDTGWDDYADGWDILTPDGRILKSDLSSPFTRLLTHPHVDEQPFTRSQNHISIPEGITQLRVRAHDLVDGFGGQEILVNLEQSSGPGFQVERP